MTVVWSDRALHNLIEIGRYIATEKPLAAQRLTWRFRERVRMLVRTPLIGRTVPEWDDVGLREVVEQGYRIIYRVESDRITIVTIRDGRRHFPDEPQEPG